MSIAVLSALMERRYNRFTNQATTVLFRLLAAGLQIHCVWSTNFTNENSPVHRFVCPADEPRERCRGRSARDDPADYLHRGCGLGREATLWLLERGVRVVGTDAWSWDAPFSFTRERFAKTRDPSIIWEGHKAGREIGYCQMEKLANLHLLPSSGFWVSCFPCKIKGASAGHTRAVALLEDMEHLGTS